MPRLYRPLRCWGSQARVCLEPQNPRQWGRFGRGAETIVDPCFKPLCDPCLVALVLEHSCQHPEARAPVREYEHQSKELADVYDRIGNTDARLDAAP